MIIIGCGDGGVYLGVRRWSSWTSKAAAGSGVAYINRCTPACAAGNFITYRVTLRLFRPRRCSNGRVEFTRLVYRSIPPKNIALFSLGTAKSPWGDYFFDHVTCP
jgi:hypothetical protein